MTRTLRPRARRPASTPVVLALLAASLVALPLQAKTLRFASAFDPQSIMMGQIAPEYFQENISVGSTGNLSDSDKAFVGRVYPKHDGRGRAVGP